MRTRYKIVILLFTVTLALGAVILLHSSDNDEAVRRFRSFFSKQAVRDLPDTLTTIGDETSLDDTSLWYGGISLLAVIMMGVAFTMARGGGLQARKEQPTGLEVAKTGAEGLLQDEAWKEKRLRQANDAAVKDLEASERRVYTLENELSETEKLLKNRDGELLTLRSQVSALTDRSSELASAQAEGESALREELKRQTDLLQSRDSAIKELEKSLDGKVQFLETELSEKGGFLKDREAESATLRDQLSKMGSAKEQVEGLLREELRKQAEALAVKDAFLSELREKANQRVNVLESQLKEREGLLKSSDGERESLRSEINTLKARLHESEATKERAQRLLQTELSKPKRAPQANDSPVKDKERQGSSSRVQDLESLLSEKEELLKSRDGRIAKLEADLKEKRTQLARHEIEIRQSIERRDIWKRRLGHFGINLKD